MWNLLLLGCLDGAKEETGDSVIADPCISEVTTTFPADGAVDVYVRAPLSFYLTQADTVSEGGPQIRTDIPGRLSVAEQGRRLDWVPEAPLAPLTDYALTVALCSGETTVRFRTGEAGAPLTVEPSLLEGRSWRLQLKQGRAEGQVADLIAPYLIGEVLLSVDDVREYAMTVRGTFSSDGSRGRACDLGTQQAVFRDAPYFVTIPTDLPFPALYGLQVEGTFSPDGERIDGVRIHGFWDARDLTRLGLDSEYTPERLCGLLGSLQLPCTACRDGEPLCMEVAGALIPGVAAEAMPPIGEVCEGCAVAGGAGLPMGPLAGFAWLVSRRRPRFRAGR